MPRRRDERPRVLGPYEHAHGYRVTTVDPGEPDPKHRRRDRFFESKEDANTYKELKEERFAQSQGKTIKAALDAYELHLKEKGNLEGSITEKMRRLRLFFGDVESTQIARLSRKKGQDLYDTLRVGRAVDTHRNVLSNARGFLAWCGEQGWINENPLTFVKGVGRRAVGKSQLTGDEARRFSTTAHRMAYQGDLGALAANMLLLMGLRQSEIWKRRVRDLDLDGTVLRIEHAKTRKSNRAVSIPDVLRPLLLELVEDRDPLAVLFEAADGGEHTKAWLLAAVKRVCLAAGVPVVCPHGLRGTHTTIALQIGYDTRQLADSLGHEDTRTTIRHYSAPGAWEAGRQRVVEELLLGGRFDGRIKGNPTSGGEGGESSTRN